MSEIALPQTMPRTILRPEDARIPRSYRMQDYERPRAASEDTRGQLEDSFQASQLGAATYESSERGNETSESGGVSESKNLSIEGTIELARKAVETGREDTQNALAGNEAVSEAVRPKLTIDLGHANITRIPEPVVDLIKDEVERLSLSHNQIWHVPYRFAECSQLRYLNIRTNFFRDFPKAVTKLPLLEILDLSRNRIRKVPEDIKNLTSLRVFSIMHNRLDDLPLGLSDMNKLQILKVTGNNLGFGLKKAIEYKESEVTTSSAMTDNEKEIAITAEIKRFLKARQPVVTTDMESGGETSEGPLDTPKPIKRVLSSRFPVIPYTSGSESSSDLTIRSPGQARAPPIPTRSHFRMPSGHNNPLSGALSRRPGVAPLISGSERTRSNSESVLQASAAARTKRMGMMTRKHADLDSVDEGRSNRHSHLRGLSHGSVLKSRASTVASGGSGSSSSPSSPRDGRRLRNTFIRRLSSLPEQKRQSKSQDPMIDGAKGILYALFQIHPHISTLIDVVGGNDSRRNSLEIVFYNASTHLDQLNDALDAANNVDEEEHERSIQHTRDAIVRECATCIMAYSHVGTQLQKHMPRIVSEGDPRYVRTLMLLLYGSMIEARNACLSLGSALKRRQRHPMEKARTSIDTIQEESGALRTITSTPTRERPQAQVNRRMRSETTIQHPTLPPPIQTNATPLPNHQPMPSYHPSLFLSRSRSNSRTNTLTNSSTASSVANTPRSGDSFVITPATTSFASVGRINTMTGLDEAEEERIFEQIFLYLTKAYDSALQALPIARRAFQRFLEAAIDNGARKELRDLWNNLLYRCKSCLDCSEALSNRLTNMRVKEPGGVLRNQREFWQLCKAFLHSFIDLATDLREARNMQLVSQDIIIVFRPVHKASSQATKLIEASPWAYIADMSATYGGPVNPPVFGVNGYSHPGHYTGASPQSVPLPATPLSAALGPAAQATVPSTPASAYGDQFFAGNVFQRADSLLNMPQAATGMMYRR